VETISRTRFIEHAGRPIVFMDFSQLEEPDLALVGMSALHKVLYRIVTSLSGRKLAVFGTIEEAKDWLVAQKEPPAGQ
jgi:hypothetical protein